MPNETTDFHEPPKPGTEFIPLEPSGAIDAVECCPCWREGYCAAERDVSALAIARGQMLAYRGESTP
jgi:hypothetical protein